MAQNILRIANMFSTVYKHWTPLLYGTQFSCLRWGLLSRLARQVVEHILLVAHCSGL